MSDDEGLDFAEIEAVLRGESGAAGPVFAYVDFGAAHGLDRAALLAAAHLDDARRTDPDAIVPMGAYIAVWRELLVGLPGVCIPVEVVRSLDLAALGVVGQIILRADDAMHAVALAERFSRLTDTAVAMVWHDRGDVVGYEVRHRPEVHAMRFPIEVMLGTGWRVMCGAAGRPIVPREVTFAHAAGYPVAAYEALFGCPVRFGAEHSAVWLDRAALATTTPLAGGDPIARRYLEAHAEALLAALPPKVDPVVAQLRDAVAIELATSGAELARVARRVAMSTRTVQRRLEEHGTSYQALVEATREQLACSLLRDRARSIIDVAFELGYADLKSFYRAFRRWTQTTPAAWRVTARTTR